MKEHNFYMTAEVSRVLSNSNKFAMEAADALSRFSCSDWGDLCESDKELNRRAETEGGQILAAYSSCEGRIYIITDDTNANPKITTMLFAYEY